MTFYSNRFMIQTKVIFIFLCICLWDVPVFYLLDSCNLKKIYRHKSSPWKLMIKFNPYPFNAIYDNTRQNRIGKLSTTLRQKHMVLSVIRVLYFIISLFHKYTNLQKQIYVETIFTLKFNENSYNCTYIAG